ncbi:MAG: hypothetical protein KC416_04530 [Myxococcales bacterium]|nr:hypothetical protein [Myxococcales bacterium]
MLLLHLAGIGCLLGGCDVTALCDEAALEPLTGPVRFAVAGGLFQQSSTIGFLDEQGERLDEAWIDSGTAAAGITAALSGDFTLPTTPHPGELVILERTGFDRMTRIALPSGLILGQHPTQGPSEPDRTAFKANPQDAVRLSPTEIAVSRYEPNFDRGAQEIDRGNDLLIIDVETNERRRIDLGALNTEVNGTTIYARPLRMFRRGSFLLVGLSRLSGDFRTAGPGAVAWVDLTSGTARVVGMDPLVNCGEVRQVPGNDDLAVVLCGGPTFQDAEGRRTGSGVVLLDLSNPRGPTILHRFSAADHDGFPPPQVGAVPLGGGRLVVASLNVDGEGTDALLWIDLSSGDVEIVHQSGKASFADGFQFDLGLGTFNPEENLLLVPSASQGILRFRVESGRVLAPLGSTNPSPCRRMPPREVTLLP